MNKVIFILFLLTTVFFSTSCGKQKLKEPSAKSLGPVTNKSIRDSLSLNAPNLGQCWTMKMYYTEKVKSLMNEEHFYNRAKEWVRKLKSKLEKEDKETAYVEKCNENGALARCKILFKEKQVDRTEINPKTDIILVFKSGSLIYFHSKCDSFKTPASGQTVTFEPL